MIFKGILLYITNQLHALSRSRRPIKKTKGYFINELGIEADSEAESALKARCVIATLKRFQAGLGKKTD
jgi:hypothetical protein